MPLSGASTPFCALSELKFARLLRVTPTNVETPEGDAINGSDVPAERRVVAPVGVRRFDEHAVAETACGYKGKRHQPGLPEVLPGAHA